MANLVIVKGLTHNWSVPIEIEFDKGLSLETFTQIIYELESIGIEVQAAVCDQGGRNEALARELGITAERPFFSNPFDASKDVYFLYDFNHVFKNWWVNYYSFSKTGR